jgi:molecular chaperone GrpE
MTEKNQKEMNQKAAKAGQAIPIRIKTSVSDEPIRVTDKRFWVNPHPETAEEEPPVSLKPSYCEELEKRLADSQKRLEEVLAAHRESKANAAAEIRQARERIQSEYDKRLIHAKGELAEKFIQILENLDRALAIAEETPNSSSLLDGIQLIRSQFRNALSELGLKEVSPQGEPFNPELAEAVQLVEVESETQDNKVVTVVRSGYSLDKQLIRPAQVIVGKWRVPVSSSSAQ